MPPSTKPASAPRVKQRERPAIQVRIGALLTSHAPAGRIKLASDPALDLHSELEFEPIAPAADFAASAKASGVCFGLVRSGYLPRTVSMARLEVKRGRWGSKPPELLQLLQPMPDELQEEPALRQRGVLRSMAEVLADLTRGTPALGPSAQQPQSQETTSPTSPYTAALLLLAAELALQGWVERARLATFAHERNEPLPTPAKGADSALIETAGLLVWRGYARRQAGRLGDVLKQSKQRNPLRKELSETQVTALLALKQPGLGGAVLDQFAMQHKLRKAHNVYPRSYALAGEFAPPELSATDVACVKALLAVLTSNPAASRREFNLRFPSNLNVVAWVYEAELLIELPGWYTITRSALHGYVKKVPAGPGTRVPSVRDLKDQLDLGRREAESLRSWYLAQYAAAIVKQPGSRSPQ